MKELQPNSSDCFVCGVRNPVGLKIKFYNTEPGRVEAEYIVPEHFQGYPGIVHGGIVAAMLDEMTYRSLITDDFQRMMFTARLTIRYKKNVPVGQLLKLVGEVGKIKSRTATAYGAIYNLDGELLAEADALLVNVPDGTYNEEDFETFGWKVYSDEELKTLESSN